jgi:hypothetical protein
MKFNSSGQLIVARCERWFAQFIAYPVFIRAFRKNMEYFSRLSPRWNTQESRSDVHHTKIHLELWQRHELLVQTHLSCILIKRFLKFGDLRISNLCKLAPAVLSKQCWRYICMMMSVEYRAFYPVLPPLITDD